MPPVVYLVLAAKVLKQFFNYSYHDLCVIGSDLFVTTAITQLQFVDGVAKIADLMSAALTNMPTSINQFLAAFIC